MKWLERLAVWYLKRTVGEIQQRVEKRPTKHQRQIEAFRQNALKRWAAFPTPESRKVEMRRMMEVSRRKRDQRLWIEEQKEAIKHELSN